MNDDKRERPDESLHEREAVAAADRVIGETPLRRNLRLAGRIAGRLLGALFLATGLAKAVALEAFGGQIAAYDIVTHPILVALLAYAIVIVECGLGAALLVNLRPRLSLAAAGALLVVFLATVGKAAADGSLEDCGCFPWATRTPAAAFVEDAALLAVAAWAWWGHWGARAPTNSFKLAAAGLALVLGVTVPAVMGSANFASQGALGDEGASAFAKIETEDVPADLTRGEHLVLLMSTECSHCQAAVPTVNALFDDPRLPKLVAVAMEDRVSRGLFREDHGARFPVGQISQRDALSLLKKEFPRLFLVRDGVTVAVWDGQMPSADDVLARVAK